MSFETACNSTQNKQRFTVIVLGDLGHSPRIVNQALSIATLPQTHVDLVGYKGSPLPSEVVEKENISIHYVASPPALGPGLWWGWYLLLAPPKALVMLLALLNCLFQTPTAQYVLIQNPPAIPTLLVAQLICWLRGSSLMIDWHNFGYSILALKFGPNHPLVRLAHGYEWWFGRHAYAHLTVTHAMASELEEVWKVSGKVVVLHDRAPSGFCRLATEEIHATLLELKRDHPKFASLSSFFWASELAAEPKEATLLTALHHGQTQFRANRPYLVVSSTSWTPDENLGMFLDALIDYDHHARRDNNYGHLAVVITGKGPERAKFEVALAGLQLVYVKIILEWLPFKLYPKLLGSADLGVSLHASSSGLDLPMKVVDMLGAGLPVCALNFTCLGELISNNENGLLFSTAEELASHLISLFSGTQAASRLAKLRAGAAKFGAVRWQSHWEDHFKPLVS